MLEIRWKYTGDTFGRYAGDMLEIRWRYVREIRWRYAGDTLEIRWRYAGDTFWPRRYAGDTLEIRWRYAGDTVGQIREIRWRYGGFEGRFRMFFCAPVFACHLSCIVGRFMQTAQECNLRTVTQRNDNQE